MFDLHRMACDWIAALQGSSGISWPMVDAALVWPFLAGTLRRRWAWALAMLIVLLVSVSRVYLGVHFISDVIGAWAVAAVLLWCQARWERSAMDRFEFRGLRQQAALALGTASVLVLGGLGIRDLLIGILDPAAWALFLAPWVMVRAGILRSRLEERIGQNRPKAQFPAGTGARSGSHAFTLIELLVVVAIIAILAGLLLPALHRAQGRALGAACLNHVKQLQLAWQMYNDDHGGRMPDNYADLSTGVWRSSSNSWAGPSSAPFDLDDSAIRQGTFFQLGYIRTTATFRCPSDDSEARRRDGKAAGVQRSRSYSMNGNFAGRPEEAQFVFDRENLTYNPAQVFVFIDEQEDSIDDAQFLVWPNPDDRWVNLPASRHDRNGILSFADGHVEQWKWRWPKQFKKKQSYWKRAENAADLADLRRLQEAIIQLAGNYRPQP
jgi:prepilin-type N-terminal cleavage/methylation domain-containing protein/prepilin-type processing-associated H-X9-DG protein